MVRPRSSMGSLEMDEQKEWSGEGENVILSSSYSGEKASPLSRLKPRLGSDTKKSFSLKSVWTRKKRSKEELKK